MKSAFIISAPLRICGVLCFFLVSQSASTAQTPDNERPADNIQRMVQHAKATGKASVAIAEAAFLPTGVSTVEEVAADYSVLVASPLRHTTLQNGISLTTWYKFRITDRVLMQKSISKESLPPDVPAELMPVASNEIVVPASGGQIELDGIVVKQLNAFHLSFTEGSSYVLVLLLECSGKRISG